MNQEEEGHKKYIQDILGTAGFSVIGEYNFDKSDTDPSHNCGITIASGSVYRGYSPVDALLITIRGTSGAEWFSNFDFCPSHSNDAVFAENFLFAAEDAFSRFTEIYDPSSAPVVLVCGHSRGAACANLLGVLIDELIGEDNVYVYTFAAPATVRKGCLNREYSNIFNYINPQDIVPCLPLEKWDFTRAGRDILLQSDNEFLKADIERYRDILFSSAPDIESYYLSEHSADPSDDNAFCLTAFDIMMLMCNSVLRASGESYFSDGFPDEPDDKFADIISSDSYYAPLRQLYEEISEDSFSKGREILNEHLPTRYMELITAGINK
ncbi:MAG: hypothetical protein HUJ76_07875 [Parasporobacterium sp.]|nr:hypothetical protein [Parasporobacterium sp.]